MAMRRFYLVVGIFLVLILSVPVMSLLNNEEAEGIDAFEAAVNSSEKELIYIGSESCPWCEQYHPVIEELSQAEEFSYLYLEVDGLSAEENQQFQNIIFSLREDDRLGFPLTILVHDGELVAELSGYSESDELKNFLVDNNFLD